MPKFSYEIDKTFKEISEVLEQFDSTHNSSSHVDENSHDDPTPATQVQASKPRKRDLLRIIPPRYRWPLEKSETMALIESLERHKNVCLIALTTSEWY